MTNRVLPCCWRRCRSDPVYCSRPVAWGHRRWPRGGLAPLRIDLLRIICSPYSNGCYQQPEASFLEFSILQSDQQNMFMFADSPEWQRKPARAVGPWCVLDTCRWTPVASGEGRNTLKLIRRRGVGLEVTFGSQGSREDRAMQVPLARGS